MGFFGFLKKDQQIKAPEKPASQTSSSTSDVPTSPESLKTSPETSPKTSSPESPNISPDVSQGMDIPPPPPADLSSLDAQHTPDDLFKEFDMPLPNQQAAPSPAPTLLPIEQSGSDHEGTASQEQPALEPLPEPLPESAGAQTSSLPDSLDDQLPAFSEHDTPVAKAVATPRVRQPGVASTPTHPPTDLPDFSEEEIAAAKQLSHKTSLSVPELPEMVEMKVSPENPYVSAQHYRHVLEGLKKMKSATKKGDAALGKFKAGIGAHKARFSAFAKELNGLQEKLIQVDNIMLKR